MQRLEVSGAVRPIYESLGFKGLKWQGSKPYAPLLPPGDIPGTYFY